MVLEYLGFRVLDVVVGFILQFSLLHSHLSWKPIHPSIHIFPDNLVKGYKYTLSQREQYTAYSCMYTAQLDKLADMTQDTLLTVFLHIVLQQLPSFLRIQ
ncbi:hypothetical protein M501DRAFT_996863 [Patellaria atrata CBS 101060]|uniref:Uncharacterized protein n=1 Tax=Patellaria atrata CBS 101060 TaxID=1346257 RepID=A0A9P4VQM0_9PEZI|nr:hypothetical protein M501DRAFT_996863 [Patellaria atrata CBS 101060]